MTASLKRALQRTVALLCSAALLAWFFHSAEANDLAVLVSRVQPLQMAGLIGAFALTYLLRAGRVFDEFRVDTPVTYGGILRLTLVHNAMVNVVPFRGGEAAFPILLSRWFGVPTARALAALLWLRLQDAFVVLALAALVWPGLPIWLRAAWIGAVALAAWAVPAWARKYRAAPPQQSLEHGRFARLSTKLREALAQSTRSSGRAWLWTFANWSVKLSAQAWLLALLLGAPLQAGLAGAMGLELAAVQPIQGVAGFGTAEFGGAALLRAHGIMLADGVQAALVLHLFVIACALCAGAAALVFLPGANKAHAETFTETPTDKRP